MVEEREKRGEQKSSGKEEDGNKKRKIVTTTKGEAIEIWPKFKGNYAQNVGNGINGDRESGEQTGFFAWGGAAK